MPQLPVAALAYYGYARLSSHEPGLEHRYKFTCPSTVPRANASFSGSMVRLINGDDDIMVD